MTHLNKNKKLAYRIIIIIGLMMLSGCVTRIADLTLVSTKNIDLSDTQLDVRTGQRQTGEDCRLSLLGITFGLPNLKEAVDEALEKGRGNIMVDQVTELKVTWIVLGHIMCYQVEGTVLTVPPPPSPSPRAVK